MCMSRFSSLIVFICLMIIMCALLLVSQMFVYVALLCQQTYLGGKRNRLAPVESPRVVNDQHINGATTVPAW